MICDDCTHAEQCPAKEEHGGALRCSAFKPMTNEEWLKSFDTEQLAEFLADKCNEVVDFILHEVDEHGEDFDQDEYWYRQDALVEWLKAVHKE